MLKLVVSIKILVAVCCAQRHFTCSISEEVLNPREPKDQSGSDGNFSPKKETGIPDDRQINLFRDQLNSLSQEVEALKNQSKNTLLLIATGSKILYIHPNFYIYQLTPGSQLWPQSRQYCQTWGGDLAVYGVKTLENRKKLIQSLSINKDYIWIGANDSELEGNWIWVNGEHANSSELIWDSGEPDRTRSQNYLLMVGNPSRSDVGRGHDGQNYWLRHGLCEKRIENQ